ncbi:response regulator, partial [Myxococcota bacterium]|nr:response regulator [Myxococcota bacterium]
MGFKVLIAEDDRHTRTILEHIFTKDPAFKEMDIELLLAADGEQALRHFRTHDPDLIISDLLMPKMDGFAFCRAVRESPRGKDKPLIITSAIYKETALLNRLREELQVTFFPKPFQVREFTNEVLNLINKPASIEEVEFTRDRITMSGPFRGPLADKSLPSILLDIQKIEGTGVLNLERGKMTKDIYFQFGRPIGAESNIRHENLGNYLVSKNILTENQHQTLLLEAKEKRVSFLKALLDSKQFNDELVLKYHSSLVKVRIVNSFRWHDGTYAFVPGDNFSDRITKAPVDPVALVFAGLKRISDLDEIAQRLEDKILSIIEVTPQGKSLHPEFARIFGETVSSQIQSGVTTMGELLGKGIEPVLVYTHIYVMAETLMIKLHKTDSTQSTASYIQMAEDPLNLSNLKKAATSSVEPEDEISIVVNVPAPPTNSLDGGLILDLPMEVEGAEGDDRAKKVRDFYIEVHEKDYFELLGVSPDAAPGLIESAYQRLSEEYSFARFTDVDMGPDHFKLEEINEFLKIARRTLMDPELKQDYMEKSQKVKESGEASLDAEVLARRGQEHLKLGNVAEAQKLLENAVNLKPEIGDYHAFYAKALYQSGEPKERYLRSLHSAIDLAPDSLSVNLIAGEINNGIGMSDEAIGFYEKVLDFQPEHEPTVHPCIPSPVGTWPRPCHGHAARVPEVLHG